MESFTESPFILVVISGLATLMLVVLYVQTRKKPVLPFIFLGVLLTIIPILTDAWITTDREAIKLSVQRLARSVQLNDVKKTLQFAHPDAPHVYSAIEKEMPRYDFTWCVVSGIKKIEIGPFAKAAKVTFVVAVNVAAQLGPEGVGFREISLELAKDPQGDWKITNYRHYTPGSRSF
ncbi:MAG: hypothetical protein P8J33_05490 [Pirellulaceae bacterium]|nr:hypothetical protein [Pirellulaceae bacterium]